MHLLRPKTDSPRQKKNPILCDLPVTRFQPKNGKKGWFFWSKMLKNAQKCSKMLKKSPHSKAEMELGWPEICVKNGSGKNPSVEGIFFFRARKAFLFFCISQQHINTSTHQHINTSTHQQLNNTSTHQHDSLRKKKSYLQNFPRKFNFLEMQIVAFQKKKIPNSI